MSDRRQARRRTEPQPSFSPLAKYTGDRTDPDALVEWVEARLRYEEEGHGDPLPPIPALIRATMMHYGVWRPEFIRRELRRR